MLVIVWWIALWGLSDIVMESWARTTKILTYVTLLFCIGTYILRHPEYANEFYGTRVRNNDLI